jgi:quercetin dioxygenase-like cupin family protein
MLPLLVVFEAGGKNLEPAEHEGEEFVYLLEGCLLVRVAGHNPIELTPGDSLYFNADLPHAYENLGGGPARVLIVATPPHF